MLQIGEVARLLGVTPKTVRHYHKLGLIAEPSRSEGGYRLYSGVDLVRLQHIRRLQSLGLSLQKIKMILDSHDPDVILHQILAGLRDEIAAEQMRLDDRRRRIETYLAEEVSLCEVVRPETSTTFTLLESRLGGSINHPLVEFDRQIFAQMDAFAWGEEYHQQWQFVADYFAAHPDDYRLVLELGEKLNAVSGLSDNAPEIEAWAREIRENGVMERLSSLTTPYLKVSLEETLGQVIQQTVDEHLSPAQLRFLQLLKAQE